MFCKNCGNELKEGMKFCGKCGNKIEATDQESHTADTETKIPDVHKISALTPLIEFCEYLKGEQEIPQELQEDAKLDLLLKDIGRVFIKGILTSASLMLLLKFSGETVTFGDFFGCSIFCWFVIGGFVYFKRSREFEKLKEAAAKKREEMLKNVDSRKYDSEDWILGLINENHKRYIGDSVFDSASIRDDNKEAFQAEIAEIIKFADDNKMNTLTLPEIIEKFYQNKHHAKVAELQEDMEGLKEKVLELKSKFEAMEIKNDINHLLEGLEAFLAFTPEDVPVSVDKYRITLRDISTEVKQIEQALEEEIDVRERAADALMSYVPDYQKTLKKISSKRAKYPDEQLSSSFVNTFDLKVNELTNALPTSYETVKNRAAEIDSEIKNGIACLTDMLEAELQSRYKRIYGRPENKLALKFKYTYK